MGIQTQPVFIALGSNLGDREKSISDALSFISNEISPYLSVATIIETKPLTSSYLEEQSNFLNTVVKLESSRSPIEILGILQSIEVKLGRIRDPNFRWAPRTIDLDLLYVGNIVMSTKSLILPHPEIQNRIFVLEPLAEIAPNFIHPRLGLSTKEMILRLK